ncbi:hypothetical protein DV702_15160 [Sporosarcina sp. PTS2304]|uniref:hypothetical protein n=1 Tax=Sporosarcina sp. PTS2304 TaxID=2283194 RepID=UPI000E0DF35D|nr:hypothetical protein [Sporosarcina sp. PTS2304]AXI00930.1 hypothetical protein DV702_15160 [Sporosarcina sp. PTS2304]
MRNFNFFIILVLLFLVGCAPDNEADDWKVSPTFTKESQVLYGTEGKFGMININGPDQPVFPAEQGRLYRMYFLEDVNEYSTFKIIATHQNTGASEQLIDTEIGEETEAKLGFGESGLWKMDVTVDGEPYTDFVVEVN